MLETFGVLVPKQILEKDFGQRYSSRGHPVFLNAVCSNILFNMSPLFKQKQHKTFECYLKIIYQRSVIG